MAEQLIDTSAEEFRKILKGVEEKGSKNLHQFCTDVYAVAKEIKKVISAEPKDNSEISNVKRLIRSLSKHGDDAVNTFVQLICATVFLSQEQKDREEEKARHVGVLMMGLEGSGKRSLLMDFMTDLNVNVGHHEDGDHHHFETYTFRNKIFNIWNVGNEKQKWPEYLKNDVSFLIFVVDSAGPNQLKDAQVTLTSVLSQDKLKGVPLAVLASRSDISGAMSLKEMKDSLQLDSIKDRKWAIVSTCVIHGEECVKSLVDLFSLMGQKKVELSHLVAEYAVPLTGIQLAIDWYFTTNK